MPAAFIEDDGRVSKFSDQSIDHHIRLLENNGYITNARFYSAIPQKDLRSLINELHNALPDPSKCMNSIDTFLKYSINQKNGSELFKIKIHYLYVPSSKKLYLKAILANMGETKKILLVHTERSFPSPGKIHKELLNEDRLRTIHKDANKVLSSGLTKFLVLDDTDSRKRLSSFFR
jgi:hypothetical protein